MISKHFMFPYQHIFSLKMFDNGPQGSKRPKFKSMKQNFTDFPFLLHEALLDPEKVPCKDKKILVA